MAENNNGNNSVDDLLWMVIGLCIFFALIWYFGKTHIVTGVMYLSDYKLRLVEMIIQPEPGDRLYHIRQWVNSVNPADVTMNSMLGLAKSAGQYYMLPVSAVLIYWAYRLYGLPTYSRKFSSKNLVASQKELWPEISIAMMHDILKEDNKKGKWAVSRSVVELIEDFKLLDRNGTLNRKKCEALLTKQIGKPYTGPKSLSKYEVALAGVFSAAINENKEAAEEALDEMNLSYNGKDVDVSPGVALFKRYFHTDIVQDLVKRHYYCNTVMYSLLEFARKRSGVLPASNFLWMRPLSRQKWYVLNNVGRKVAWADMCGVYNHYLAEVVHGEPIKKPFVKNAVDGLESVSKNRVFKTQ